VIEPSFQTVGTLAPAVRRTPEALASKAVDAMVEVRRAPLASVVVWPVAPPIWIAVEATPS
jgi:hypothetical protein